MDAVIKLKPEELTQPFFNQLQQFAAFAKHIEIRLDSSETINGLSETEIEKRLQHLSNNKTLSFSMEELDAYLHKLVD